MKAGVIGEILLTLSNRGCNWFKASQVTGTELLKNDLSSHTKCVNKVKELYVKLNFALLANILPEFDMPQYDASVV